MANTVTTMRLVVIATNQASFALSRIGRDMKALQATTESANKAAMMQANLWGRAMTIRGNQQQLKDLKSNKVLQEQIAAQALVTGATQAKLGQARNAMHIKELANGRSLFDQQTRRLQLELSRDKLLHKAEGLGAEGGDIAAQRAAAQAQIAQMQGPLFPSGPMRRSAQKQFQDQFMRNLEAQGVVGTTKKSIDWKKQYQLEEIARAKNVSSLQAEAHAASASLNEIGFASASTDRQLEILNRQLDSVAMQEKILGLSSKELGNNVKMLKTQLQQERLSLEQLNAQFKAGVIDGQAYAAMQVELIRNTAAYNAELQASKALQLEQRRAPLIARATQGRAMSHVGRGATLFGGIGTLAFGVMGKQAADFNTLVSLAATQASNTQSLASTNINNGLKITKMLQKDILEMMKKYPATAEEMAKASYEIYSSTNTTYQGGIKLLELFNKVAVAGGVDLPTATAAGVTALNDFSKAGMRTEQIMNTMFAIVRFGRMTFAQFNTMLQQVAPAAKGSGLSLLEVGGAMATLTRLMPKAQGAAVSLARLMVSTLSNPDVQKGLAGYHVQVMKVTGGMRPLLDIMKDINKEFPFLRRGIADNNFFRVISALGRGEGSRGNVQSIQAVRGFTLLIRNMGLYQQMQANVTKDTGEFARAFDQQSRSFGVRWSTFQNQLKATAIIIGQAVIPMFLKMFAAITTMVNSFKEFDKSHGNILAKWGAWIALGTLLSGILLTVVGSIISLTANIRLLTMGTGFAKMLGSFRLLGAVGMLVLMGQIFGWDALGKTINNAIRIIVENWRMAMIAIGLMWLGFRTKALISLAIVTAASIASAESISLAFRMALIKTGWGALIVGAGMAAAYIITHWDKVRIYFIAFGDMMTAVGKRMQLDWDQAWNMMLYRVFYVVKRMAQGLSHLPGFVLKGMGTSKKDLLGVADWVDHYKVAAKKAEKEFEALSPLQVFKNSMKKQLYDQNVEDVRKQTDKWWRAYVKALHSKKGPKGVDDWIKAIAGNDKGLAKALAEYAAFMKAYNENLPNSTTAATTAADRIAQKNEYITNSVDTMVNRISAKLGELTSLYDKFRQTNETIMGSPFQVPLGNFALSAVNDAYTQMQQFGIAPPQSLLKSISDAQLQAFKINEQQYGKLRKAGAPQGFIDDLKGMGQQGGLVAKGLLSGPQSVLKQIIANWKQGQKDIQAATTIDFTAALKQWQTYGKRASQAIVQGLLDKDHGLAAMFKKEVLPQVTEITEAWIKKTFPDVIKKATAEAAAEFEKKHPKKTEKKKQTDVPAPSKTTPAPKPDRKPASVTHNTTNTTNINANNAAAWRKEQERIAWGERYRNRPR